MPANSPYGYLPHQNVDHFSHEEGSGFWGEAAFFAGTGILESTASAYGGGGSMFWGPGEGRIKRGLRKIPGYNKLNSKIFPSDMINKLSNMPGNPYVRGGVLHRPGAVLHAAQSGAGGFSGGRTTTTRLGYALGKNNTKRFLAGTAVRMGVQGIWGMMAYGMGKELGQMLGQVVGNYDMDSSEQYAQTGGFFADTQSSFTQRQRSIRAIHNSQMTTRAALGNEASFMHIG